MPKLPKPSRKHHFVSQAQLRHFASDPERRSIWVYDKKLDRPWVSSILNAGSKNDFNTVEFETGKWNFEDIFQEADGRSAALVSEIVARRELAWIGSADHAAMVDLLVTQMLRTHFIRLTRQFLAGQMREIVRELGYDPDGDPAMAMPTDAGLRLGAVRSFLERDRFAIPMFRLQPALFQPPAGRYFILSDDPVVRANAFQYGDVGLESHGIMVLLPIAPDLALVLVCPTIISRYEALERADLEPDQRFRMERYRDGFRSGESVEIEPGETEGWNRHQVAGSVRYLYAADESHFDGARAMLRKHSKLRIVETSMRMGEIGRAPPRRRGMPRGRHLVVQGRYDHAILPIAEIDDRAEALTVRTTLVELLGLIAADANDIRAELYEDGVARMQIGRAMLERVGDPADGWFRVVHRDESLHALVHMINADGGSGSRKGPNS